MRRFIPLGHPFGQMISFGGMILTASSTNFPRSNSASWKAASRGCWFAWNVSIVPGKPTFNTIRANASLISAPKEKVSEYLARHIDAGQIFVGCEGEEPDIAHAIKRIGNKPWVFSSDYPHEVNNEFCKHEINEFLENDEISDADKAAFLHGNARRFYNLGRRGTMTIPARIGLIIPSSNRLTEPQFNRYVPPGVGVHVDPAAHDRQISQAAERAQAISRRSRSRRFRM